MCNHYFLNMTNYYHYFLFSAHHCVDVNDRLDEALVISPVCGPTATHIQPDTDTRQEKDDAVQIQSALSLLKFR